MDNVDAAPIISLNTGTPQNENPDSFNIQVNNSELNDQAVNSSPKSSLSGDPTNLFEKLNESMKVLGRIFSRDNDEKSSVEHDIDVMCFSPGHEYIVTWCKEDGVLAVWTFQLNSDKMTDIFAVKTPFNKTNVKDTSKIFLSVEENGGHAIITNMSIVSKIDETVSDEPNIDLEDTIFLDNVPEVLQSGSLICEEISGFSVWDLEGTLKQWFYIECPLGSKYDNLYAISQQGNLGTLCIYHVPTALAVCNIEVSIYVFHISFLQKKEQIFVCLKDGDGVTFQLWDCWSGLMVYEESCPHFDYARPFLFSQDMFVQAIGNELTTHSIFIDYLPISAKSLQKHSVLPDPMFKLSMEVEFLTDRNVRWCHIRDDENISRHKFILEPWNNSDNPEVFLEWLDSERKRFIIAGKHSMQVYKINKTSKFMSVELQYIWTVPITQCADILFVSLENVKSSKYEDDQEKVLKTNIRVELTNNYTAIIPLPEIDKITYRTVADACIALNFLQTHLDDYRNYFSRLAIRDQLRKLISSSVTQYPSAFNKIVLDEDNFVYPMKDFILLSFDDLVHKVLDADRYIPLYHNNEQTESALSLLLELQKSELVERLIAYIFRHLRQNSDKEEVRAKQLGYSWTICNVLLDLFKYYPDKGEYIMKESSYFTTSLETPARFLPTDLGDPFKEEERSYNNELATLVRDSRLPPEYERLYLERAQKTHPAKLCVVPWPDFCVYPLPSYKSNSRNLWERIKRFWSIYVSPNARSPFAEIAFNGPPEMFGEIAMKAIIKFNLADDLVPPPEGVRWQNPAFSTCSIIPFVFLLQEFRQMMGRTKYWSHFFNYADLASYIFPLATSIMVVWVREEPPLWLKSYSVLLLWAFANSLFILLRTMPQEQLVPSYQGVINSASGGIIGNISMIQIPQEGTNMWTRFEQSIFATYSFLGIVKEARRAHLRQRAQIIAEIELFLLATSYRYNSDWFPHLIYYEAHADSVVRWRRKLDEESGEVNVNFIKNEIKSLKAELQN
ncbi:18132_t:CDS:2, partial [Racocetra fulgida]